MQAVKADYGQDAPGIRQGMIAVGAVGAVGWLGVLLEGDMFLSPTVAWIVKAICVLIAAYGFGMAAYMTWGSRVGKIQTCERLLDELGHLRGWTGSETVIDIGCGRGLMMIKAAKRLTTGKAIGVDIWRSSDQSGNSPEATLRNAQIEGVADRVLVKTGEATKLPIDTASCDIVLSNWTVHNIEGQREQFEALAEMWRVCRPGGLIVVSDIAGVADYLRYFSSLGAINTRFLDGGVEASIANILSGGTYKPQAIMVVR